MANILALETSTDICSVSVNKGDDVVHFHEMLPRQHSEKLLQTIQTLINKIDLSFEELDAVAVAVGPGSYTGIRLSCAVAQGIAYAHKINAVCLSSLELLSLEAKEKTGVNEIIAISSSNQGKVYAAESIFIEGDIKTELKLYEESELKELVLKSNKNYVGEGCTLLEVKNLYPEAQPRASLLLKIAQLRFDKGKTIKPESVLPIYFNDENSWKKLK